MPERSKGFDLRSNVFALVGSNPTLDTENDVFHLHDGVLWETVCLKA